MAHPFHHALSSVQRWSGTVEDYLKIHNWFDASKAFVADFRHRALRHHAEGIFWCEEVFGVTLTNSAGRVVPVRWIGEQHVKEDLHWIPTLQDWFRHLRVQPWMAKAGARNLHQTEIDLLAHQPSAGAVPTDAAFKPVDLSGSQPSAGDTGTHLYQVAFVLPGETAERSSLARARSYIEAAEAAWDHYEEAHGGQWFDGQVLRVQRLCEPDSVGIVYAPAGREQLVLVRGDRLVVSTESTDLSGHPVL